MISSNINTEIGLFICESFFEASCVVRIAYCVARATHNAIRTTQYEFCRRRRNSYLRENQIFRAAEDFWQEFLLDRPIEDLVPVGLVKSVGAVLAQMQRGEAADFWASEDICTMIDVFFDATG
jgi:hypothetical protein